MNAQASTGYRPPAPFAADGFSGDASSDIVNWNDILELRSLQRPGEKDLVLELIATFLVDTRKRLTRLEEARFMNDTQAIVVEAQTIKCSAAALSAAELRLDAEAVERSAQMCGIDIDYLITRLRQTLTAVQDDLHRGLARYAR